MEIKKSLIIGIESLMFSVNIIYLAQALAPSTKIDVLWQQVSRQGYHGMDWLIRDIRKALPEISKIDIEVIQGLQRGVDHDLGNPGEIAKGLPTIVKSAVEIPLSLHKHELIGSGDKVAIDTMGDGIFQENLRGSPLSWVIASAEGEGDGMPAPSVGEEFGQESNTIFPISIIYDPVDGTTVASEGGPGSVVLIGIGPKLKSIPDLRSIGLMVPILRQGLDIRFERSMT